MQSYAIGIDIGTGSVKAVGITVEGKVIARAQLYYSLINEQSGFVEQDPQMIWKQFGRCLQEIITAAKSSPSVIGLSSYMHSLLVVDDAGSPLTNVITWADIRSEAIAAELRNSGKAEELYRATGMPVHSMSPLCKIIWLRKHDPRVFNKAYKFISIKEFIWYQLFGIFQADHSIANATGLFNINSLTWNTASLELCGIAADQLSGLVPTGYLRKGIIDETASLLTVGPDTAFCIGASDGCLAVTGSGVTTADTASVTIGTSGAVRILSSGPVYNYPEMTFSYVLEEGKFVCGGPVNNGGNVVQWLLKRVCGKPDASSTDYEELFQAAGSVPPGSEGLLFLPYLYGERAPLWDEKASGLFFGIREQHSLHHFIRAALEGICYGLNHVLHILESSVAIMVISVSGGFTHSQFWMQLLADVTGKTVCLQQSEDASATGAALMAMKSTQAIKEYKTPNPGESTAFTPDAVNHARYKKYFELYKELYSANKEIMHKMYEERKDGS